MMPKRSHIRVLALAVTCMLSGTVVASLPGHGATAGSVVGAAVPASTSIANQCTGAPATTLGTMTPGSTSLTDTGGAVCRFQFGSSNATATARIYQRDQVGTAMSSVDGDVWSDVSDSFVANGGVDLVDATFGYRTTSDGTVLRTSDGAATWTPEISGTTQPLHAVAAVDATNAYAVGGDTGPVIVTRSTAGGSTWTVHGAPGAVTAPLNDVDYDPALPSVAVAVGGDGRIIRTTDSGATWTVVHAHSTSLMSVSVLNATLAFASGFDSDLLRSTDGGVTWTTISVGGPPSALFADVLLTAGPTLWVSSMNGLLRSTDPALAAPTFTNVRATPTACPHMRLTSPAPATIMTTQGCTTGQAIRSINALDPVPTFTIVAMPIASGARALDAISATRAIGMNEGAIVETTDWTSWTLTSSSRGESRAIDAWGADDIAIAAGLGYVYVSNDGASTWVTRNVGAPVRLSDVRVVDSDSLLVVGTSGSVYRTDDDGATWTPHPTGSAQPLSALDTARDGAIIVVGEAGTVMRSIDDGSTWTTVTSGTASDLVDVSVDAETGDIWATTNAAAVLHSSDDGRTWSTVPIAGSTSLRAIVAAGDGVVWALDSATLWRTTNHGTTWTSIARPASAVSLDAIDSSHVTVGTGFFGDAFSSDDAGATWNSTGNFQIFANAMVTMVDAATTYSANGMKTVYRRVSAATVPDYAGGPADWSSNASLFGACLQAIGASTTAIWSVDVAGTAGQCEPDDADPWRPISTIPDPVASTNATGATGSFDLVFGMHAGMTQAPKKYVATFNVEVIAPAT
jgi:photosystem II stability/assembly factor-like uncharacterized protein